jgi:disulfide bond formation protein DsbB
MRLVDIVLKWLSCPAFVCAGIIAVSVIALVSALIAQYVFDMPPCILCLYQRAPYVLAIMAGMAGLAFAWQRPHISALMVGFCAALFLVNSVIAFYHTGVELHWWQSAFEACAANIDLSAAPNLLERIQTQAKAVPCNVIPWQDPIFGLSMANYNVIMCFGLFIGCGLCAWLIRKNQPASP